MPDQISWTQDPIAGLTSDTYLSDETRQLRKDAMRAAMDRQQREAEAAQRAREAREAEIKAYWASTLPAEWADLLITQRKLDPDGLQLNVWRGELGVRRIYVGWGREFENAFCYHITGTRKFKAGTLQPIAFSFNPERTATVIDLCKRTAQMISEGCFEVALPKPLRPQ